ncbi:MAG: hypothetical protein Q7S66_03775 [bacterium]|nr:hypothetical protein [bacterium]
MDNQKIELIENKIVEKIISWLQNNHANNKEIENKILNEIKAANFLNEEWQIDYSKNRILELVNSAIGVVKKKSYLGWISLVLVFVVPKGTVLGIILAIYILTKKEHDHTIPKISLIFALSILLIFFLFLYNTSTTL